MTVTSVERRSGLGGLDPATWSRLWPHPVGNTAFLRVCEADPGDSFELSALVACMAPPTDGPDPRRRVVAGVPLFRYGYRLDMPLGTGAHRLADWLERVVGRRTRLPVLVAGSPFADRCPVGIDPGLAPDEATLALEALAAGLVAQGREVGAHFIAIKDLEDGLAQTWHAGLTAAGFTRVASMPVAVLDLPFPSFEAYLDSLPAKVRADLRRKERQGRDVEFEAVPDPAVLEPQIEALYAGMRTSKQAAFDDFSALPAAFFTRLGREMPESRLVVARIDGEIASFNLFFADEHTAVAAKIGLAQPLARRYNLYFLNWMQMVRWCIARGIRRLELGQTSYPLKLRLGCRLERRWVYFRHRSDLLNRVTRFAGPLAAFDRLEAGARGA